MVTFGVSAFRQSGGKRVDYYNDIDLPKLPGFFGRAVQREVNLYRIYFPEAQVKTWNYSPYFAILTVDGVEHSHIIAGAMQ